MNKIFQKHISLEISAETHNLVVDFWGRHHNFQDGSQKPDLEKELLFFREFYQNNELRFMQQVHGNKVVPATDSCAYKNDLYWADCDAMVSDSRPLMIRTADCVPVILYHTRKKFFAVAHAGWRGLKANVLTEAINALRQASGSGMSENVINAIIGPHIAGNVYETSEDVYSQFNSSFYHITSTDNKKAMLNLGAITAAELRDCKIPEDMIFHLEHDTLNSDLWFSHRGGSPHRNITVIRFI